jgi:hypothetical protein
MKLDLTRSLEAVTSFPRAAAEVMKQQPAARPGPGAHHTLPSALIKEYDFCEDDSRPLAVATSYGPPPSSKGPLGYSSSCSVTAPSAEMGTLEPPSTCSIPTTPTVKIPPVHSSGARSSLPFPPGNSLSGGDPTATFQRSGGSSGGQTAAAAQRSSGTSGGGQTSSSQKSFTGSGGQTAAAQRSGGQTAATQKSGGGQTAAAQRSGLSGGGGQTATARLGGKEEHAGGQAWFPAYGSTLREALERSQPTEEPKVRGVLHAAASSLSSYCIFISLIFHIVSSFLFFFSLF